MKAISKSLAAVALGGALVAGGYFGVSIAQDVQFAQAKQHVESTRQQLAQVEDLATVFREVSGVVEPSVVHIEVNRQVRAPVMGRFPGGRGEDFFRRFFPDMDGDGQPDVPEGFRFETPRPGPEGRNEGEEFFDQRGTGSGVIVEADGSTGYVLTNNHVAGQATEMTITLADGRRITDAKLVGADPKTDLAIIRIQADNLIPAKWGNSDELRKGDWILAFGSPFGYVGSMTHGIVSALNREAGILGAGAYEDFIQVDAPINPGNSGGPLVNVRGEVVGINTAIASRNGGFQGIGFAIPSNMAQYVYGQLREKGSVTRGWLGVSIADVKDANHPRMRALIDATGYKGDEGIYVNQVLRGTPASDKLQPGDVIVAMDGKPVESVRELRETIAKTQPGKQITLRVFREGEEQDVQVTVAEQPEDPQLASAVEKAPAQKEGATLQSLGLQLETYTEQLGQQFGFADVEGGAVVTAVTPGSVAARSGLAQGDVITRVGKTKVNTAEEAAEALRDVDLDEGIRLMVVDKDGQRLTFLKNEQ